VVMKNVQFNMVDAWVGSNMNVKVKGLDMDARSITISNKTVDVSNLVLDDPYFSMLTYTGRRPALPEVAETVTKEKTEQEWKVFFGNVKINNGRYRNDRDNLETPLAYFDGRHLDFSKISGSLNNIGWTKDTVSGNINLSAIERSGLEIKALRAKTTFHPKAMIFDGLYLQTNNSVLGDYLAMRYDALSAMNNFIHEVVLEANFDKATISSDDIAFFAPQVKSWNRNIRINGDAKGTVDAIASRDLELWAGNDTYVHGAVSLVGLPNINETLINIEAEDLRTTYRDATSFFPAIRRITTPDLAKLSFLRFRGTYTGFINDFVTYGTLQTNLGTLQTDLNMKFPRNGEPSYSGSFSTDGFQLGAFVNSSELGILAFNGKIKGRGFEWKTLDMDIDGTVRKIQYADYTYQNITAIGNLSNRLFNGDFKMDDPNAQLSIQGLVDFRNVKPIFNVKADIGYANLKALQLTGENFELAGKFDLNLEASSLSDLLGSARIYDASLTNDGKRLSFDSLLVSSTYEDGLKRFKAVSNEFDVDIRGDFDLKGLPDAFTLLLSRYYPSYIKAPRNVKPQVFEFDITTGVVEDYLVLIDKRLKGLNNSHIQGSLNTTANTMTVDADIPHFAFNNYDFTDIQLKGSGDFTQLILTGEVSNAQVGDSLFFPQTAFTVRASNDVSDIIVNTTSNQAINQANLSAQVKTFNDGATIVLNPSTFILNGKTWNIEQGGELNFRKNTVVQGQVVLRESNQEIRLWTAPDDEGSYNNLHVAWNNINLGDISPLITKAYRFEGLVSGEVKIEDPTNRLEVSGTFNASELRVDNDSIGGFRGTIGYDQLSGLFTAKGSNTDPEHRIELDIAMDFADSADTFRDRLNAKFTNFQLKYLNRFLGSLFSQMDGFVTGTFDLLGEGTDRDYIAKAKISDASFLVNFTQVKYWVDDTEFEMRKDIIDLDGIRMRDKDGRSALVTGFIRHKGFRDMYYDIKVETESDRMQLINTNENHNQQFYGKAWGGGTFVLLGPQADML
ncbi:MAG: translocation/assembly module TamB domain-containing protein, partial [Flavisolibacter sp.]